MGNAESDEQLKREVLFRLRNDLDKPADDHSVASDIATRVANGAHIAVSPTPGNIAGAIANQGSDYISMAKANSRLRRERKILSDLVEAKLRKKAALTNQSFEKLRSAKRPTAARMKWDKTDTRNLLYGGPWGIIATGIRHKRQNDINDLEAQYKKLVAEGYGMRKKRKTRKL